MGRNRKITPDRLHDLWQKYTAFKRSHLAYSTIARDFHKVDRLLSKVPQNLGTSIELRDHLLATYSSEYSRRLLSQFRACLAWAVESDLASYNPFEGLPQQIRKTVHHQDLTGFTATERDRIIKAFDLCDRFYSPWVRFLFWTGCRPEEAAALTWEDVGDCSAVRFTKAAPVDTKRVQTTKTGKTRVFPANDRLRNLLQSLERSSRFVLPGVTGGAMEYHNFQNRHWKPLIEELVNLGEVSVYKSQYHARHTFITLALDVMSVKDIAYLVGNSPNIIYRHYASRSRNLTVPEF